MLERIARVVAAHGSEVEKKIMLASSGDDPPKNSFLWSINTEEHALYKQKVAEYIKSPPPPLPLQPAQPFVLPESLPENEVEIPQGMMRKEFGIIKLTAQFVARYGSDFWMALWDRVSTETQFQFLDRGHREDLKYKFFTQLAVDYSELIMRWENMPEKSDKARMDVVVEGFLAAFEAFKKKQEKEEVEVVVGTVKIERSDFDEYFVDIEKRVLPPPENGPQRGVPLHMMSSPPEPKRHKSLVPEDQFFAQHPDPSTITVFLTSGRIITITVQSLLERVAGLKEKIAAETQIPLNRQILIGEAGVLEDDMSLAYYNLGVGEMLTLAW